MNRPRVPVERILALVLAAVLFGVLLGYLLTQPAQPTGRVTSVDRHGNVTD